MKKYLILILFNILVWSSYGQSDLFWEKEEVFSSGYIGKFETFNNDNIAGIVYAKTDKGLSINLRYSANGTNWSKEVRLVNRYFSNNPYGDDFSPSIDSKNNLYICYRVNKKKFTIVKYSYQFNIKRSERIIDIVSDDLIYLPKLFIDTNDEMHLIYSSNREDRFIIEYKKIDIEGKVAEESIIGNNFKSSLNPVMSESDSVLYVVFQAKDEKIESGYFYNIILASSKNWGKNWTYRRVVTSRGENNQGPNIFIKNKKCYLVWEKEDKNFINHIYYKSFGVDSGGEEKEKIISSETSEAHSPKVVVFDNSVNIFWYDNIEGNFQNYFTQIIGNEIFESQVLRSKSGRTLFHEPLIFKKNLKFFWVQSQKTNILYYVKTDTYVAPPKIVVKNMPSSRFSNKSSITFQWDKISDISGIKGYRLLLTRDKDDQVTNNLSMIYPENISRSYNNLGDGKWYFKIKAFDNAGNGSTESVFPFTIDTAPPQPPVFVEKTLDEDGSLNSNSPLIEWQDSNEPLRSYRYYQKFFSYDKRDEIQRHISLVDPASFKITTDKNIRFDSLDNGMLLVGIQGYDMAGNASRVNWNQYILNDYAPSTYINYISPQVLPSGENVFYIYGRGFKIDGDVKYIYVDKDRKAPYDYIIESSHFIVESDRLIKQNKEIELTEGSYYIGVDHPLRGIKFYKNRSSYSGEWIFKFSEKDSFSFYKVNFFSKSVDLTKIILLLAGIFWIAILLLVGQAIFSVLKEKVYIKHLLGELEKMKNQISYVEYEERRETMKKKGMGLTLKYTILILSLVITIVSATSITLSAIALRNETINLANEMKERATLVMTNYETTMLDIYTYEKGFTEAVDSTVNTSTLPDIGFAMFREENDTTFLRYGEKSEAFFKGINIDEITDEEKQNIIVEKVFTDKTEEDIESLKTDYDGGAMIYPEFDPTRLSNKYIFIKPIIVDDGENKRFVSTIILGYSFEKILRLITHERINLITLTIIVTLIAILLSIVGAVFLATTTIRPIKVMSKHVNVISLTEDYETLLGTDNEKIEVKTSDEIGVLASSINDMTSKLIEKAKSDKQMMLGKEIQKKFIPLEPHETDHIDIYGFYEGAKGVSGDYFDYKKLDDDHYAFIICDVAGKAVPAALIMVQISTIFHSFCANFDIKKDKLETVGIVNTINDTVEERGFTGRFAAILVLILNIKTGKTYLTNAGYTQLLIYRSGKGKAEWTKLNEDSGAAGVFPSNMLPHPYVQENITINKGDLIYLFTDGIEESRNGKTVKNEKGDELKVEFGNDRIKAILDGSGGKSPKEVITRLIDEEKNFRGDIEQYDDLTIMGIKRK